MHNPVRIAAPKGLGPVMKTKLVAISFVFLGACSSSGESPSLTFVGIDKPSVDPQALLGLDVHIPGDVANPVQCTSDNDCAELAVEQCVNATCNDSGECFVQLAGNGEICDDGNPCTAGEFCLADECGSGESICDCSEAADCVGHPIDLCLGDWDCVGGGCEPIPDTGVSCDDLNEGPCVASVCDPGTGSCETVEIAEGTACEDDDACTTLDFCKQGECEGGAPVDCSDDNPCTDDVCDGIIGCSHGPHEGLCNDGDVCTLDEKCQGGACVPQGVVACATDGACMNAICDPSDGCLEVPKEAGTPCDDGNVCTEGDACHEGQCESGDPICACEVDADCPDDGNLCNGTPICAASDCVIDPLTIVLCEASTDCSIITCVPATGACASELLGPETPCDDAGPCTSDGACQNGACVAGPKVCDDANPCTKDTCDASIDACVFTATTDDCDDGDPCTLGDSCKDAKCVGSATDPCEDGDVCTLDQCAKGVGCQWVPVVCEDGIKCTDDECEAAVGCVATPKSCPAGAGACITSTCHEATGLCVESVVDGAPCDDADPCTVSDVCKQALCEGVYDCDDDNECTFDSCSFDGCVNLYATDGDVCDDGDSCSSGDQCHDGACQGMPLDCIDADPCTDDACVAGSCQNEDIPGCVLDAQCLGASAGGTSCNDGDNKTKADMCIQGMCRGFTLTKVEGAGAALGNIAFTQTNRGAGHWFLASQSDALLGLGNSLVQYDDVDALDWSSLISVNFDLLAAGEFTGIHDGFAVKSTGELWEYLGLDWSKETPVAKALSATGQGNARAVWVYHSAADTQIFIAGEEGDGSYTRECSLVTGTCKPKGLNMPNNYWYGETRGRALTGRQICADGGQCYPGVLLAGDSFSNGGYFNNIHYRSNEDGNWYSSYADWWTGNYQTADAASYDDGRYLVVGKAGYVRYFDGSNWSNTLSSLKGGTWNRDFTGVWIGADVVIISANVAAGDETEVELWASPRESHAYYNGSWTVYSLGDVEGSGSGVFDVWGAPDGEIRAVGSGKDDGEFRDGLVWVRKP